MILDLKIQHDLNKAEVYFAKLVKHGSKIELKKIPEKRTLSQNSYVHALFTLFGNEFGWSNSEAKEVVKKRLGYTYTNCGTEFYCQTSKMNTKELTIFIDKFRNFSASEGCYLPSSDEMGQNWDYFAKEIERAEIVEKRYTY